MIELLKEVALQKQIQRLLRMREISQTVKDIKERESLHKFHVQTLKALIKLHPNASKNIIKSLGTQFQLEGYVRTARYKDAINVGQV